MTAHGDHELLDDALLHVLDDGLEQPVLAVEVVVQRAPADARLPEDLLDRRVVEALLGEQARRNVEQLAAGRLPLGDAAIHGCHGPPARNRAAFGGAQFSSDRCRAALANVRS